MADDAVLEILRRIQADLAEIKVSHGSLLNVLLQDVRMIRAAINDMAKDSVTPGEIAVLHEDFTRMQRHLADLSAKVEVALAGR